MRRNDFIDTTNLARRIPHRTLNPAAGELLHKPMASEPLNLTIVILAHMSKSARDIQGFIPLKTPAEILFYLEEVEKSLLAIALERIDPAEIAEDPAYLRTKRFFTQGRRIPIKLSENERERQARTEYELQRLFGQTN